MTTELEINSSRLLTALFCAGAVAARLRVYDSGICFVCSHLSSGENEGDELKRNYDYSEIVRRGQFPPDSAVLDPETSISGSPGADSTLQVTNPQPLGSNITHMCALSDEVSCVQIAVTPPEHPWCAPPVAGTAWQYLTRDNPYAHCASLSHSWPAPPGTNSTSRMTKA